MIDLIYLNKFSSDYPYCTSIVVENFDQVFVESINITRVVLPRTVAMLSQRWIAELSDDILFLYTCTFNN